MSSITIVEVVYKNSSLTEIDFSHPLRAVTVGENASLCSTLVELYWCATFNPDIDVDFETATVVATV